MKIKYLTIPALTLMLTASCATSNTQLPYFSDIAEVAEGQIPMENVRTTVIEPNDELLIDVSSADPMASAMYNLPLYSMPESSMSTDVTSLRSFQTYRVDSKGDITMPVLGKVHVQGMSVDQLTEYLTKRIGEEVADPVVTVKMLGFVVSIGGEVVRPGRFRAPTHRYTILELITQAGDLTPYGVRNNVLLVREENGERKFVHLDLTKADIMKSPYFYLRQNDYVYVSPNKVRQSNAAYDQLRAYNLQVISTVVSVASVIASLVIALTVK